MFAQPRSNLAQFGLGPGMQVADLGAGSGHYTIPAAHLVGGRGVVYAIDVQQDLLDLIKSRAAEDGAHNVQVVWGDIEHIGGTRLRDESIDRVIISDALFQVEDKARFLAEAFRIVKRGGKLLLVDWSDTSSVAGPDAHHIVSRTEATGLLERGGFRYEREISAGAHHYGLIFKKA